MNGREGQAVRLEAQTGGLKAIDDNTEQQQEDQTEIKIDDDLLLSLHIREVPSY